MRERPEPEFFFGRHPKPGETMGLDDQKENDQPTKNHMLEIRDQSRRDLSSEDSMRQFVENDGQHHDKRRAKETPEDTTQAADDDHEKNFQ